MIDKNFDDMSVSDLISYITDKYHEPLRENIKRLDFLTDCINANYSKKYPEIFGLFSLYNQFKTEILSHITREDFITFPTIQRFEKIYTDKLINLSDDFELLSELINEAQMVNQHNQFNLYLSQLISFVEGFKMSGEDSSEINMVRSILINLQKENITHSQIENKELYFKGIDLQNKLKERLSEIE